MQIGETRFTESYLLTEFQKRVIMMFQLYRVSKACNYDVSSIMPRTLEFTKNTAV